MNTLARIRDNWRRLSRTEWETATGYVATTIKEFLKKGELTEKQESKIQTHLLYRAEDINNSVIDLCKKIK